MPQLDFTIWFINLLTCWLMFSLVFVAVQNIVNHTAVNKSNQDNFTTNNNLWPWH
uniref:ATP synthase complex subunit 8 n=1 Tax=Ophionotus victoriae TaxID=667017 RepID=A0A3G2WKJ4_9ECHI|nr:ATP synthase F0 subunit 8 [Ophionotus victoriae]AYO99652.1 ATP synthase F0 subunit 8 [Ophionotus victoriae]